MKFRQSKIITQAFAFYFQWYERLEKIAEAKGLLPPPDPDVFNRILKAVLTSNVFHFRGERWFIQKKGVAMGSSISLFVASVYMHQRTKQAKVNITAQPQLLFIRRYIDDFVGILLGGGLAEVQELFGPIENEHVKLTYVVPPSGGSLEALDLRLEIVDGRVVTRLYRKPTDGTMRFVHWRSCHPPSLLASIPYAQMLRVKTNCTFDSVYREEIRLLVDMFKARGYPAAVLDRAYAEAEKRTRQQLLERRGEVAIDCVNFVTWYNAGSERGIRQVVREFWGEYHQANPLLPELLRVAFRCGPSLGRLLAPNLKGK